MGAGGGGAGGGGANTSFSSGDGGGATWSSNGLKVGKGFSWLTGGVGPGTGSGGLVFCCFIGLEVGNGGVDNCGASLEGRGTDSSLGFFIFCFCFFVSLIGMDDAGCAFVCSAMGGAGFFEVGETSGGEEFASVVSAFDGDTEGAGG